MQNMLRIMLLLVTSGVDRNVAWNSALNAAFGEHIEFDQIAEMLETCVLWNRAQDYFSLLDFIGDPLGIFLICAEKVRLGIITADDARQFTEGITCVPVSAL